MDLKFFAFPDATTFATTRPGGDPIHPDRPGTACHLSIVQDHYFQGIKTYDMKI
jgi:hypothetical protein